MQEIEDDPEELISTRLRYFRAMRLLKQSKVHNIESLKTIMRDHQNYPDAICNHSENEINPLDREKTINSLIIDLSSQGDAFRLGEPLHRPIPYILFGRLNYIFDRSSAFFC